MDAILGALEMIGGRDTFGEDGPGPIRKGGDVVNSATGFGLDVVTGDIQGAIVDFAGLGKDIIEVVK